MHYYNLQMIFHQNNGGKRTVRDIKEYREYHRNRKRYWQRDKYKYKYVLEYESYLVYINIYVINI